MRIEMQQGTGFFQVEVLGQPVERTGVIVFEMDRHRDLRGRAHAKREKTNDEDRPRSLHRAG